MDLKKMIFAALFTALICVCSIIRINLVFTPVPVTMQFFAIFLAGAILEMKWSVISVFIYITLGSAGLPVFSGMNSGLGVLAGPTGGFIIGFLAGVFVVSAVLHLISNKHNPSIFHYVTAMLSGMVVVYALGTIQFMLVMNVGLAPALTSAVLPFIPADCIKLALAAVVARRLKPAVYSIGLSSN